MNAWATDNFTTADILFLLLSFLHNKIIPCKHNAWATNDLVPLDMLFLSIIVLI